LPARIFTGENSAPFQGTHSNIVERASAGGGRTWATVATLLQTAKMNDVDPHAWLTQTLERIAQGWPISNIHPAHALELQGLNGLSSMANRRTIA
jgi:transposase